MSSELSEIPEEESNRLAELEEIIERDLPAFVRVGSAFLEINDRQLFRKTHTSLKEYIADRWPNLSFVHAYRLMKATTTLKLIGPVDGEIGEMQLRALGELPEEIRAEAWERACLECGGTPSSSQVQAIVDQILEKPPGEREFAPPPPEEDEGPRYDESAEREKEWLDSLPLNEHLSGLQLKRFHNDALLYRRTAKERGRWRNTLNENLSKYELHGNYMRAILIPLKIQSPENWLLCPKTGGCLGSGRTEAGAKCPKCLGHGYWFNGYRDH